MIVHACLLFSKIGLIELKFKLFSGFLWGQNVYKISLKSTLVLLLLYVLMVLYRATPSSSIFESTGMALQILIPFL